MADIRCDEYAMTPVSLQDKLHQAGSPVRMLRESQMGPYVYPIPAEFSNWRDEQRAWRDGVALLDQSFHMTDLYVEGPDALRLLSYLGINSFANFGRDKAKQLVTCSPDGYVIGDAGTPVEVDNPCAQSFHAEECATRRRKVS